eukprot:510167-Rhodomonas_salina.1
MVSTRVAFAVLLLSACVLAQTDAYSMGMSSLSPSQRAFAKGTGAGLARGVPLRPSMLRGGGGITMGAGGYLSSLNAGASPMAGASTNLVPPSSPSESTKLTPQSAAKMIDETEVFIFDCDGVIWRGEVLIDGVGEVLNKLRFSLLVYPLHQTRD